jgi:hypothetical protein
VIDNRFRAMLGGAAGDAAWHAELIARYWDEQRSEQENMDLIGYWLRQGKAMSAPSRMGGEVIHETCE